MSEQVSMPQEPYAGYRQPHRVVEDAETHPCRPQHAVRGISTALLAARLHDRATHRSAPRPNHHGRKPGSLPGQVRTDRIAEQALLAPGRVARVRNHLGPWHPLLLSRLAVRRGRQNPGDARRAAALPHSRTDFVHGAYPTHEYKGLVFRVYGGRPAPNRTSSPSTIPWNCRTTRWCRMPSTIPATGCK